MTGPQLTAAAFPATELKAQLGRVITENERLAEEVERLTALVQNIEQDRMKAEAQRDVIQEWAVELAKRLSALIGPMAKAQDAIRAGIHDLGNRMQAFPTRDELDDREVRIIRICKPEITE
jgi:regulator of replication initiation timing